MNTNSTTPRPCAGCNRYLGDVMREVRKDFEGVVASLQEKLNEKTRGLKAENEHLRAELDEALRLLTTRVEAKRLDDACAEVAALRAAVKQDRKLRTAAAQVLSWSTRDTSTLASNPPQNAGLFHAQRVLREALEKKP